MTQKNKQNNKDIKIFKPNQFWGGDSELCGSTERHVPPAGGMEERNGTGKQTEAGRRQKRRLPGSSRLFVCSLARRDAVWSAGPQELHFDQWQKRLWKTRPPSLTCSLVAEDGRPGASRTPTWAGGHGFTPKEDDLKDRFFFPLLFSHISNFSWRREHWCSELFL